jgi:hypothetical protein
VQWSPDNKRWFTLQSGESWDLYTAK